MAKIQGIDYHHPQPMSIEIPGRGQITTIKQVYSTVTYKVDLTLNEGMTDVYECLYQEAGYLEFLPKISENLLEGRSQAWLEITYSLKGIEELKEAKPHLFV